MALVAELEAHLVEHNPIDRLSSLAKAGVPILHIHGDADTVVSLEKNSGELARRYRALGGKVGLIVVPGKGHQVCDEFFHCRELADFVIAHAGASGDQAQVRTWRCLSESSASCRCSRGDSSGRCFGCTATRAPNGWRSTSKRWQRRATAPSRLSRGRIPTGWARAGFATWRSVCGPPGGMI